MQDPYAVLGLAPGATEDEVTAAYRKLAKKYHPDLNPGDSAAEEKMRQVNAAYEQIKTEKTGGASYERADGSYGPQPKTEPGQRSYRGDDPFGGFGFGGFEDLFGDLFGGGWQYQRQAGQSRPEDSPMARQAKKYLQTGQYQDALRVLSQMPRKDAEWYYMSAIANAGVGNRVSALGQAREAARMEPNNFEYQQLVNQLQRGGEAYRQTGQRRGFNMQTLGRTLWNIMLAQLFCFCCCRPF